MATGRVERRLAAILAADVAGYSRLMERDEAGTLARLKAHRKELVEPLITEHRGRIVKLMGDGALCEFASVVDAVACAVAIQRGMTEREATSLEAECVRFRIGVNLGDVIIEGQDIYGDGVNVAARLEQLAEPGGVVVSGTAFDHLRGELEHTFAFLGEQRLKNIERPVGAYRHTGEGGPSQIAEHTVPTEQLSVAVLPFTNMSGDPAQDYFSDGITEDIITELSRFRDLLVIAHTSSSALKGQHNGVAEVGRRLGVRFVLEGSVRRAGNRARITAQLIDATTGGHLWAERYDRQLADVFAVQDEVVERLVSALSGWDGALTKAWKEVARRKPPASLHAWDYCQLAKTPLRNMDRAANAEVRRLLERAAALDPSLARAWALLAHAYFDAAFYGWTDNPAEMWRLFHHAAQKAVELDFTDAHAQVVLGMSHAKRGRARAGAEAWERAVAQGPSDALVVRAVAVNLPIACGIERAAEAVELAERALLRLDPLHPSWQWASLGTPLYFAGRYAEAAAAFEKVGKHWVETRLMLAISYAQIGEQAKAAQQAAELIKLEPGFTAEAWVDNDLYQAGSSSAVVLIEGARKARLPICAMSPTAPGKSGYAAPAEVRRGAGEGDRREDLTGAGDRLPT